MEPRISLITLGVRDLVRARRFYEQGLGWRPAKLTNPEVAFYQLGGIIVGLWSRTALAEEAKLPFGAQDPPFHAISLAHNVREREEVDAVLAEAGRAGGHVTCPGTERVWGGYSGYFTDPDGHLWEVAWNPGFAITDDGRTLLPE